MWGIWLRHCLNGREDEYRLIWPSVLFSLPQIEKVHRLSRANSYEHSAADGESKKSKNPRLFFEVAKTGELRGKTESGNEE